MFGPSTESPTQLPLVRDRHDARTPVTEPDIDTTSRTAREQGPTVVTAANQATASPPSTSRGGPKRSTLQARSNRPKFHFCPADVLILGLGMAIFGLQASAAQRFDQPTKSVMLMTCMGIVIVLFAALAATIIGSIYPYSELKTGGMLILPNCQVLSTPETTQLPLMLNSNLELCDVIQASHVLSYFLLSMEAIAAFLVITHWINVKEMRGEGLPLTLGELLRMNDGDVERASKALQIQAGSVDMETRRRMVAHKLDLIPGSPV
ncbi:hypothetical protein KEM54_003061 [Ascosphaera aggregata]|nr:hypothetical protein KEM54_003061 [Ascosphaera aggregata]